MFASKVWKAGRNTEEHGRSRLTSAATRSERSAQPAGVTWDIGAIPIFPPAARTTTQNFAGPRRITVGATNGPLEHQAERAANLATGRQAAGLRIGAVGDERSSMVGIPEPVPVRKMLSSPGRSLDGQMMRLMQSRFGHDFSQVRVHDDAAGAEASRAIGARAFTSGNHIALSNSLDSSSSDGLHLLAHELAHVAQQSGRTGRFSCSDSRSRRPKLSNLRPSSLGLSCQSRLLSCSRKRRKGSGR
jgi:uncharacterized protein DUF4157